MKKNWGFALAGFVAVLGMGACAAVQRHEIVVRFEDLRQDFLMMELAVENKQWAEFDWNTMTVTLSRASESEASDARASSAEASDARASVYESFGAASGRGGAPDMRSIRRTPEIDAIQRRREARADTFAALRAAGKIGEDNDGLAARPPEAAALSEAEAADLAAENADRRALFAEFKKQLDAAEQAATLAEIGRTFGEARRRILKPGEWYQDAEGEWKRVPQDR